MANEKSVSECKRLRSCGACPRECEAWRPSKWNAKKFCNYAMKAGKVRK